MFRPHYPDGFDYENFYGNFFGWHKTKPNNNYHLNKHKFTTEATTTEQFTDSTMYTKISESVPQSPEENTKGDNNGSRKEEIDANVKENTTTIGDKREDDNHKDSDKSETSSESNKLLKSTEHDSLSTNTGIIDATPSPIGMNITPAEFSILPVNQLSSVLNSVASNNASSSGYLAPSLAIDYTGTANANHDLRPSVPQDLHLNILQNPVNNNVQPNAYNIVTMPNNVMTNNMPKLYYLVGNNQAVPLNNGLQTQTPSQIYALVPLNNLGSNVIINQPGNLVNQQLPVNQPNNYVPLMSQPNYISLRSQATNLVPVNNQGNQYVNNQPNNLVRFELPNNVVAVNNNQPNNVLTVPNNLVILNGQPNNIAAVDNQPNNLVALNTVGNYPFIEQAQPQLNIVLYPLKDEEENSDKQEKDIEKKDSDNDQAPLKKESTEVVDA